MLKKIKVRLEGDAPLLMHSGRLADPLDQCAIDLAEVSSKRKKTKADHERMSELEWLGGIYYDDKERPIIPAELLEACIRDGAKKVRKGKDATAGVIVEEDALLVYDGPKTVSKLVGDKRFVDRRGVRIKQVRVMRTRPRFDQWSAEATVLYNDEVVSERDLERWIADAGRLVGLGDYRPRFGRFTATFA